MDMKRLAWLAVAAALAAGGVVGKADAVSTLVFQAVAIEEGERDQRGRVYLGSRSMMTLAGHGGKSIAAAAEVARRLNALAEEGLKADEIALSKERRARTIVARGKTVVRIDQAIATAHKSDLDQLARAWTKNLQTAFSRPYLAMKPLVVPVGETRAAPLRGNTAGRVQVRAEAPVASAVWDEKKRVVRVAGLQEGETRLVVSDEANVLSVPLRGMKYAARLGKLLPARVTGNPASAEVVARAVKAAVSASLMLQPGAWGTVMPLAAGLHPVYQGRSSAVPVYVSAAGDNYLPRRGQYQADVHGEQVELSPAALLMVSNWPERLREHGMWFEGKLAGGQPTRLLYHHVNAAGVASDLAIELWNLSGELAWVHVIAGVGGPSFDEAWAGHRAARSFLTNKAGGVGWMVPVPPRTAVPVLAQPVTKGATASGIMELRTMGTGDLSVQLYLGPRSLGRLPRPITVYRESPLLGQWHYPKARQEVKAQYVVGREWAFVTIGDQPAAGLMAGDELRGSYGVLYDINLELVNPTAEEARVAIVMEAAGGPARGALLVDGRITEAAMLRQEVEVPVSQYRLSPGEVRRVHIQTLPQAGSNYPVRLVARPA